MKKVLIVDDDASIVRIVEGMLKRDPVTVVTAADGEQAVQQLLADKYDLLICDLWMPRMTGLDVLCELRKMDHQPMVIIMSAESAPEKLLKAVREQAMQVVPKPFNALEFHEIIRDALASPPPPPIEVISATPDWVELIVPCELRSADRIQPLMQKLKADLPEDVRITAGQAFRELLLNAIEWGGKLDATAKVRISYLRARRMILYRISDPGSGFNVDGLNHAAISNPSDNPTEHMKVRDQKGLRPGGLGLLMTKSLVDELIFNEKRNEVVFVKYLEEERAREASAD